LKGNHGDASRGTTDNREEVASGGEAALPKYPHLSTVQLEKTRRSSICTAEATGNAKT
jgi:hypothetical protein